MATIIGKDLYGNVTYKIDDNDTQTMLPNLAENGDTIPAYGGQPKIVTTAAEMTDTDVIYLYMGDEEGYTSGDWYYYDAADEEWKSGGAYVANPVTIDDTLTQAGEAADAKATGDAIDGVTADLTDAVATINTALDTKADTTGVYENLTAGNAQQLEPEKKATDRTPYTFRPTPGDYRREEVEVVGGSVVWNQLVQNGDFANGTTGWSSTTGSSISVTDGVCKFTTTTSSSRTHGVYQDFDINASHVFYASAKVKNLTDASKTFAIKYVASGNYSNAKEKSIAGGATENIEGVFKPSSDGTRLLVGLTGSLSAADIFEADNIMLIDLTTLLGSTIADYIYTLEQATAGAGVAFYQKYFGTDYKPYSVPTIKSVEGVSGHVMRDDDENIIGNYPLDSSLTLRGIPKIADGEMYFDGDTYSADGTVTRKVGFITLNGSEDWQTYAEGKYYVSSVIPTDSAAIDATMYQSNLYEFEGNGASQSGNITVDKRFYGQRGYGRFWVYDSAYTTVEALKTALTSRPLEIIYPLQTPTTESATPYTTPQICASGGTEEWVTTGVVPVGQNTLYWPDLTSKVEGLPGNFSDLIAPTEKSTTASRSYAENRLFILNNVLYKVVSAIASGETITPGTNATAATLDDVITELRALIAAIE